MPRQPGNHVDDPAAVGMRLREARKAVGLTQRQLAFEGCTAAYISRIEAGARIPSLQLLRRLARQLGTSADYLATGSADGAGSGRVRLDEADAAARLGELELAREIYEEVLESGELIDRVPARRGLAEVAWRSGDPRQVVNLLAEEDEGVARSIEAGAWRADRLGRAYLQLAEYDQAIATLETGLDEARTQRNELDILRLSTLLANAMLDSGNVGRAEELLAQALRLAEQSSDPVDLARVWWSQSRVHIQQNRPDLAATYVRKTIGLLEASEHSGFAAAAFQLLARIENDRGNGREALELVERGQDAASASGDRYFGALFELERARALAHLGERAEAASVAMRASALLEETNPSAAGRGYGVIADVYRTLGDGERACEVYELAAERLPDADPFKIEIYTRLGELFEEDGRTEEAMAAYKQAAQLRTDAAAYRS